MNFLIIENDSFLSNKIKNIFEKKEEINIVKVVSNYQEFVNIYDIVNTFNVILCDINLGEYNRIDLGIEIVKLIRKKNNIVPIIIISGFTDIGWIRMGFDVGANDYICKPFRLAELEVRVFKWAREFLQVSPLKKNDFIEYNGLHYIYNKNIFYYNGIELELTKLNKIILLIFLTNKEFLISESFLFEKIWGDNGNLTNRNIRVNISRLKKSLSIYGLDNWIKNVRGEGYLFKK